MGGKTLKFPKRAKYSPHAKGSSHTKAKKEKISEEDHKERLEKLKEIGLLKNE